MSIKYICGEEALLVEENISKSKIDYLKKNPKGEIVHLDATNANFEEVKNIIFARGLFSRNILIILKSVILNNSLKEFIIKNFSSIEIDDSLELILVDFSKPDKRSVLYKTFHKASKIWDFPSVSIAEKRKFIKAELSRAEVSLENNIIELLLDKLTPFNLLQIRSELKKIVLLFKANISQLVNEDLSIVTKPSNSEIWELFSYAVTNKKLAFSLLNDLLKKGDNPQMMFGFLGMQTRNLLQYYIAPSSMNPFTKRSVQKVTYKLDKKRLYKLVIKLAEIDNMVKSGKLEIISAINIFLTIC